MTAQNLVHGGDTDHWDQAIYDLIGADSDFTEYGNIRYRCCDGHRITNYQFEKGAIRHYQVIVSPKIP